MKQLRYLVAPMVALVVMASAAVISAQGPMPPLGTPPGGQPGQGQPPRGSLPMPGDWAGTVQTVTSTSLTVLRSNNETFTAVVSSTTKIELMVSQSTGTVNDIQVGNNVTIAGHKNSNGSVAAAQIVVEPSGTKAAGAVSAVSGTTITLTTPNETVTVVTTTSTKFLKGKDTGSLSDVTKGTFVLAYGTKQSDGSISATYVLVNTGPGMQGQGQPPQVQGQPTRAQTPPPLPTRSQTPSPLSAQGQPPAGQPMQGEWVGVVQTVSSTNLTVLRSNNQTFTATISSTTKIELLIGQTTGTVSDIQAGNNVTIEGRPANATSVAANRVLVEPSGSKVSGAVTAISDATISLTSPKDKTMVVTRSDTKFYKGKNAGSLSDVTTGAVVTAYGTKQTDGSIAATYVLVNPAPGSQPPSITAQANQRPRPTATPGEVSGSSQEPESEQNLLDRLVEWFLGLFGSR